MDVLTKVSFLPISDEIFLRCKQSVVFHIIVRPISRLIPQIAVKPGKQFQSRFTPSFKMQWEPCDTSKTFWPINILKGHLVPFIFSMISWGSIVHYVYGPKWTFLHFLSYSFCIFELLTRLFFLSKIHLFKIHFEKPDSQGKESIYFIFKVLLYCRHPDWANSFSYTCIQWHLTFEHCAQVFLSKNQY